MRIAFLCNGLEPGRDGVGDYTRRLAVECVRQGHECCIVAFNDCENAHREMQEFDDVQIDSLRCSNTLPWGERFQQAREFLEAFNPDWVSLQFVPYGFNPKGIPWRVARDLKPVIGGRPLHIMFHELWIGFGEKASLKERLIGAMQRNCIFRALRALKPKVVHTSNATYIGLLKTGGVTAVELPLYGNIPVVDVGKNPAMPPELLAAGVPGESGDRSGWWLVLSFGTLHPQWEPEPVARILSRAATRAGKRICWIASGRMGTTGEAIWEKMQRDYGHEFTFVRTGPQASEQISVLMQIADFGVAFSPWNLMGKSSASASMLDHGLPIIFSRDGDKKASFESTGNSADPLFYRCDDSLVEKLAAGLPKRQPTQRSAQISARFLASLTIA